MLIDPNGEGESTETTEANGAVATEATKSSEQSEDTTIEELQNEVNQQFEPTEEKVVDTKARDSFLQRDESLKLDAQLLKAEGKGNIEIVRSMQESGLYQADQINRLKKLMVGGNLFDKSEPDTDKESEKDRFERWTSEKNQSNEKNQSIKWFSEEYAKELGINSKNAVAIESRKQLLRKATEIYNQTTSKFRNFKNSLQLASAYLGLNNKELTASKIKKAVRTANTSVANSGTPQKTFQTVYTQKQMADILEKDPQRGRELIELQMDGKVKLID